MWITEKLHHEWGWDKVWQDEDFYWFFRGEHDFEESFDLPDKSGYLITWLYITDVERTSSGIIPDYDKFNSAHRGAIVYESKECRDTAWDALLVDPVGFIIRTRL